MNNKIVGKITKVKELKVNVELTKYIVEMGRIMAASERFMNKFNGMKFGDRVKWLFFGN